MYRAYNHLYMRIFLIFDRPMAQKDLLSPIIYLQILMMRIPAEIYDYVSANKRHLVIPHRLMPYPEEVHIYAYIF
jgi:hypothetical protein